MSIFKETFRKYVENQFKIRQTLIAKGNSDKGSTSRLTGGPDGLAPGAFYSYGQKQCVIRLSSMVDLMEDIGLDLGGNKFESYKGETFARNFILEGGILSDFSRNKQGEQVTRKVTTTRGGFPSSKKKINLSYGDPSIASNPDSDGYGAVPMPGIIDANIRTKSAYGSLREAKVNFVCHNLRQLEILELLYMRPGYPVLMEWGWSPYIKNDGSIENSFPMISDEDYFWDDKQVNQQKLQENIINKKEKSNGNYDGFVGFVTNFNYSARPDGGFDCSTELISMGEVLDSLKLSTPYFSSLDTELVDENEKQKILYQSNLGFLIKDIFYASQNTKSLLSRVGRFKGASEVQTEDIGLLDIVNPDDYTLGSPSLWDETSFYQEKIDSATKNIEDVIGSSIIDCIIKKDQVLTNKEDDIQTKEPYIRWDALAALINEYVIPTNEKGQKPIKIVTDRFVSDPESRGTYNFGFDPILYSNYTDNQDIIMDVSCDPKVCILPHQFTQFNQDEIQLSLSERINFFFLGREFGNWDIFSSAFTAESKPNYTPFDDFSIEKKTAERRIGGIFIGIITLNEVFRNTFLNKKNATLGDFLKNLWDKINEQCPMHNFGLRVDHEFTDIVQVIDLPISTDDIKEINYDKLFKFNVHSNDTIVREFKYDTQIPNALKATIAINAQSGATSDDLDSVTFAAFNRSIKSRLHSLNEKFSKKEEENYRKLFKIRLEKEIKLVSLKRQIQEYNKIFFNLIDSQEDDDFESIYGNIKAIIKEAQSLELYLEKSTSGYLKNQSIIPINLNLVLDGISGIIIGNVFKVDESRLPKAYRKSKIAFVALGEEQNITAGQDWTTNIRGQVILFPTETKGKGRPKIDYDLIQDAITQEVTEAREGFAVAESTSTTGPGTSLSVQEQQLQNTLEQEQFDNEGDILESLGYTNEIVLDLIANDPQWLSGNREYVIQNQIPYNQYSSFGILAARNAQNTP